MRALGILGLVLVLGALIGLIAVESHGESTPAVAQGVEGRLIKLGTQTMSASTTASFPLTDVSDCSKMFLMARGSASNGVNFNSPPRTSPDGIEEVALSTAIYTLSVSDGFNGQGSASAFVSGPLRYFQPRISISGAGAPSSDVTAWIWCSTSPSFASVGGISETPLGIGGGSGSSNVFFGAIVVSAGLATFFGAGWYVWRRWASRGGDAVGS